ncbi:MFS transporter [Kozakia baliensis]|uniref:MFS transporter n=1 Tax=Kozakia baliensis TaxID=153496 RepID=A0A1D8UT25_9PROT|nr:MFS transporter [Kozakia baliensis]AOX16766.1 MFS transporter [Kozakia baliensis]GBR31969.1 sugar phosphate permease [Kozakia baliensis NRIC 0488]GEL64685.1 MFS transporter [Kozakia baliensis]
MPNIEETLPSAEDPTRASAVRKALWKLLPFLILMYMIAFLDRSNVGSAKQALHTDIGISDAVFAFGAGVFFVGYALFEVPSNLILYRVGARRWMTRIMVTWGLVSAAMMFVVGDKSFIALRSLLGITEAGFFPGIMLYLTFWFPEKERTRVLGFFYFGYPLAMTLGSPLSGALFGLDGIAGLKGWQWMFLLEGLLAVIVGAMTLFVLPDRPKEVNWLTDDEKNTLESVLAAEEAAKGISRHGHDVLGLLRSAKLIQFLALYGVMQIASYGVVFYLPEQVSGILHEKIGFKVGLVSALPWGCAVLSTFIIPRFVQRYDAPRMGVIVCLAASAIGLVMSGSGMSSVALTGLCLAAAGVVTVQAVFWNFPLAYFSGLQAAGAIALINAIGNLGGFAAPNIRALAIHFWQTPMAGLYAVSMAGVVGLIITMFLPRRTPARVQPAL